MRRLLLTLCPEAEVRPGTGQEIPLPDGRFTVRRRSRVSGDCARFAAGGPGGSAIRCLRLKRVDAQGKDEDLSRQERRFPHESDPAKFSPASWLASGPAGATARRGKAGGPRSCHLASRLPHFSEGPVTIPVVPRRWLSRLAATAKGRLKTLRPLVAVGACPARRSTPAAPRRSRTRKAGGPVLRGLPPFPFPGAAVI
jgi:hypothetical protein